MSQTCKLSCTIEGCSFKGSGKDFINHAQKIHPQTIPFPTTNCSTCNNTFTSRGIKQHKCHLSQPSTNNDSLSTLPPTAIPTPTIPSQSPPNAIPTPISPSHGSRLSYADAVRSPPTTINHTSINSPPSPVLTNSNHLDYLPINPITPPDSPPPYFIKHKDPIYHLPTPLKAAAIQAFGFILTELISNLNTNHLSHESYISIQAFLAFIHIYNPKENDAINKAINRQILQNFRSSQEFLSSSANPQ
jgi:hypothetical protein